MARSVERRYRRAVRSLDGGTNDFALPGKFDALVDSGLVIAGEPVWQFLLSAAEFILITNRETQRGVRP
jgi:hypothetical protein